MSGVASSCGQACSRGQRYLRGCRRGPDSMVSTCRWRPSAEARASAVNKQKEELAAHAQQVNQREQEVEKLEGLRQERE
jgi:hypothetical protein